MADTSAIITGVLRIIHPELFHTGCEVISCLQNKYGFTDILNRWATPFNAMSIITHRESPPHRDIMSCISYYDILGNYGAFDTVEFSLPSLSAMASMRPGGLIAICGQVVRHGVEKCTGDRVCYAWYMRGSIHAHMEARPASWMTQDVYRAFVNDPQKWFHRDYHTSQL